jgi:hypothetical protein
MYTQTKCAQAAEIRTSRTSMIETQSCGDHEQIQNEAARHQHLSWVAMPWSFKKMLVLR